MSSSPRRWSPGSVGSRSLLAVVAIAVAGLALRLFDLGGRVFHWDEGRVGYWTLRYAETGEFAYAPIIHGPFLRIVNATVFGVLPPTDGTARLVVAVVGGLLPLSAWLFRAHLDRAEVVALAAFLAFNPLLVYYSRFMRNDVLVGGFALVALGFAVRALDTRRLRYLYPSAAFLALSLSTKANTILYVLCFAGAAALVVDHRLVRRVHAGESVRGVWRAWRAAAGEALRDASGDRPARLVVPAHLLGAALTFLAIIVALYAPRPLLYASLEDPSLWLTVIHEATVGSARELVDLWIAGDMQSNPYLEFLGHELETLAYGAAVVCAFAIVGVVVDGYVSDTSATVAEDTGRDPGGDAARTAGDDAARTAGDDAGPTRADGGALARSGEGASPPGAATVPGIPAGRSRAFVAFATYWALASLLGYPAATDINAPWSAVHVVIPLTVPAAVGVVYVARRGLRAARLADRETAALAAVVLLVAGAGMVAPTATYWNSTDAGQTEMVQWAQPHNDLRVSLDDAEAAIAANGGDVDVLFVGGDIDDRDAAFYVADESAADDKGAPGGWYDRLPLPWYFERAGATVDSVPPDADHAAVLADAPPVVVVPAADRSAVDPHLDGHVAREHELRLWSFPVVVYVDEGAVAAADRDRRG
ncbi:TIGR03663 family protein [Halorubrum sp. JWXQ-INN 858]|uniref:flippase activity-associated protein Agl23 n=1 Tax=Halorubrum sp. JWXQ-INN 858 TaxID=2690782 RepID=UPI00135A0B0D|nr:flippase activity-associated protein Agl23 [Halorubrum sp. JWXQ-INN 858]MWV65278.1 TIGR03663 family protein [Halorubrum sp. JWXQ-INN 858]